MLRGFLILIILLVLGGCEEVTEEYYTIIQVVDTDTGTNEDPFCINGEEFCTSIYNPTCMTNDNGIEVLYVEGVCVCIDGEAHREFGIQMCPDGCETVLHGVDYCLEDSP